MVVDMTLEDGSKWHAKFFIAPALRTSLSGHIFHTGLSSGFPDVSRLEGRKSLVGLGSVVAAIGPNGPVLIDFSDEEGQIGSFSVSNNLQGIVSARGGGTWARIG